MATRTQRTLEQLTQLSLKFLNNSLAPSTTRNYKTAGIKYKNFCHQFHMNTFPPSESTLMLYVTKLATHSSHSSIKVQLAAIRYFSIFYTPSSMTKCLPCPNENVGTSVFLEAVLFDERKNLGQYFLCAIL